MKLLSLFCGCGGLDRGFESAGFATELAYDLRPNSVKSWIKNTCQGKAMVRDVTTLTNEVLDHDYGDEFKPDGVIGGPPCQGFSSANRKGSVGDPRNQLVVSFFNIALSLHKRRQLKFIVMENVPAIKGKRGGDLLDKQMVRLKKAGFEIYVDVLNAQNYQVPQRRKRLFLIAINSTFTKEFTFKFPEPLSTTLTVRDAIYGLPEPMKFRPGLTQSDIKFHQNHWCMQPKSEKFKSGVLKEGYTGRRSFKTLFWDQPSYTASYGNREVHIHPSGKRRLSVYEAMLIQGFDPKTRLMGTMSEQITQVSEAVPPPLGKAVAVQLTNFFRHSG
ncbi:MAG: DNA (cytosine-5-)-methyltransferase [Alphaproteobacteria bacterium]|nr:MAG: DNA (cytosine-5-)-methyltransferase [Alphaproteobacteria bacterium]